MLHAINYLLGELDEQYLTTLREFGGLQSYPSRSKDPDPVDYSTGSVGIGATAPIWGALARRYVSTPTLRRRRAPAGSTRWSATPSWTRARAGRRSSTRWSAELGEVVWIVDFNRQSLDRVVPNIGAPRLQGMFAAAGWQVLTVKYGRLLHELFARPGGDALRDRIDEMSNPEYQRLLRCTPGRAARPAARRRARGRAASASCSPASTTRRCTPRSATWAGTTLPPWATPSRAIDDTRPTVIFAYTVKGYGLPSEGHPQNHSALLTGDQLA